MLEAQAKARELLTAHRNILDALAAKLIDREILSGEEIDVIFQGAAA